MSNQRQFTISQLATEFAITTRSIRYYEDEGLLSPERDANQRIYSKHDKLRLKLILRGKRLGFSLNEIRELFNLYDASLESEQEVELLMQMIAIKRSALLRQQEDIQVVLMELKSAERRCSEALANIHSTS
ncbi:MerR family DNA-binding transcriptional regulator [Alginatibacterium sediminis]|uniref:MerR family DNA-binding transcriptional regulator n=1 Tax=Alginatibacterium sediminis TaxID=2164068 RepID=A0A420EG80_9ALTE|nr:MerR family DNA-binding transcriptional regulator [Alginatibacterium sediminis]RKF19664.1 MerR family DNA-binding transcriptional regulator [Alginatibacterium sediminis]